MLLPSSETESIAVVIKRIFCLTILPLIQHSNMIWRDIILPYLVSPTELVVIVMHRFVGFPHGASMHISTKNGITLLILLCRLRIG